MISRRDMLRAAGTLGTLALVSPPALSAQDPPPNLLYMFTDQQSATMLSCTGNSYLNTPALDELAAHGTRFERAYSTNPVCVPARIGMMTGQFPGTFGARDNASGIRVKDVSEGVRETTLGALLGAAGYDLAYGGKVHLPKPLVPHRQGFRMLTSDQRDGLAAACAAYLKEPHERPFCLVASFINPHDICYMAIKGNARQVAGMTADDNPAVRTLAACLRPPDGIGEEEFLARHCPPLPPNIEPQRDEPEAVTWLLQRRAFRQRAREQYTDLDWRLHRWAYCRLTERVDRQIGVVLAALREAGLEDNTVVVFSSDHGDMDAAHRMEHKTALYEEAARIPFIVMHRGHGPAGQVDATHLVSNGLDLIPTLCDYAGVPPPAGRRGLSVRPLVEGREESSWRRTLGVESQIGRMVVRDDGLKFIRYDKGTEQDQLLDLRRDPHETRDFSHDATHAEALTALRKAYGEWFAET